MDRHYRQGNFSKSSKGSDERIDGEQGPDRRRKEQREQDTGSHKDERTEHDQETTKPHAIPPITTTHPPTPTQTLLSICGTKIEAGNMDLKKGSRNLSRGSPGSREDPETHWPSATHKHSDPLSPSVERIGVLSLRSKALRRGDAWHRRAA